MSKLPAAAIISAAAVLLSACGNAEPPKSAVPRPAVEKGIFTSTSDCADAGKISAELCAKAIDMAVAAHEADAPTFKTRRQCEAAAGAERCGKTVDGRYRPLLQAFFVLLKDPPSGMPLYPTQGQQVGFQTQAPAKKILFASDESLLVSYAAATLAHENAKLPVPDTSSNAGEGLADVTADVH